MFMMNCVPAPWFSALHLLPETLKVFRLFKTEISKVLKLPSYFEASPEGSSEVWLYLQESGDM